MVALDGETRVGAVPGCMACVHVPRCHNALGSSLLALRRCAAGETRRHGKIHVQQCVAQPRLGGSSRE